MLLIIFSALTVIPALHAISSDHVIRHETGRIRFSIRLNDDIGKQFPVAFSATVVINLQRIDFN